MTPVTLIRSAAAALASLLGYPRTLETELRGRLLESETEGGQLGHGSPVMMDARPEASRTSQGPHGAHSLHC